MNMNKEEFKPKPIIVDELPVFDDIETMTSSTFAMVSTTGISAEDMVKLSGILDTFKANAMTMNYNNDGRDEVTADVFKRFQVFSDVFLAFKNFNRDKLKDSDGDEIVPSLEVPTAKAHKYAALLKYKNPRDDMGSIRYNKLNETVKLFSARDIHMLLGSKCSTKVKLLIVNTEDDAEKDGEIDYKTTGSASFPILIANKFDIPVFNIHKSGRLNDLSEYMNTL